MLRRTRGRQAAIDQVLAALESNPRQMGLIGIWGGDMANSADPPTDNGPSCRLSKYAARAGSTGDAAGNQATGPIAPIGRIGRMGHIGRIGPIGPGVPLHHPRAGTSHNPGSDRDTFFIPRANRFLCVAGNAEAPSMNELREHDIARGLREGEPDAWRALYDA